MNVISDVAAYMGGKVVLRDRGRAPSGEDSFFFVISDNSINDRYFM